MKLPVTESTWQSFRRVDFTLNGKQCVLVMPEKAEEKRRWLLKTEYFEAFPFLEVEMLRRGWHVAYMENTTRWFRPEDAENKAALAAYLAKEYSLSEKCIPVGMSCGGLQAIYFAAYHPECIAGLYLDAPVTNLLSCPGQVGKSQLDAMEEFTNATGMTLTDLINYRRHPIDCVDTLVAHRIPVILVSGDSDVTVPFDENGAYLAEKYKAAGAPITIHMKKGGDHHPHGLPDVTPLVEFCESVYAD